MTKVQICAVQKALPYAEQKARVVGLCGIECAGQNLVPDAALRYALQNADKVESVPLQEVGERPPPGLASPSSERREEHLAPCFLFSYLIMDPGRR